MGYLSELGMSEDKNQSENDTSYTTDNNPVSLPDEPYDDFMCLMRTDGSTIASSGGVTVITRRVPKTITSLNGLELELPIPLSPSLRITRESRPFNESCANNSWYKRVWACVNKPFTSK
ncbi:MAG: hypothetical protein ACJAS1_007202 [Oleiphilaceae bacterium]|jgi:hypothetical protein